MPVHRIHDPSFKLARFVAAAKSDSRVSHRLHTLIDELIRYYDTNGCDNDIRMSIEHCKIKAHIMTAPLHLRNLWNSYVHSINKT